MNSDTLSSMIHYIYTGELADGWQDLDIQDVTIAADMYDLPGWMELFNSDAEALRNLVLARTTTTHSTCNSRCNAL